jgi:hypothetical protein
MTAATMNDGICSEDPFYDVERQSARHPAGRWRLDPFLTARIGWVEQTVAKMIGRSRTKTAIGLTRSNTNWATYPGDDRPTTDSCTPTAQQGHFHYGTLWHGGRQQC